MAIDSYLDTITSQHRDKTKFIAWLSANLTKTDHIYNVLKSMDKEFDIDNAIGTQLDTLGIIVGRSRILNFEPINGTSPTLDDDAYRLVLKAKIAMNNWNGTIPQIYEIWDNIFDDIQLQIKDHQDMNFTAYILGYVSQMRQSLISKGYIVPKPEGVKINYIAKSPIPFNTSSSIIINTIRKQIINMDFDFTEKINLCNYAGVNVSEIQKQDLNMDFDFTEKINSNQNIGMVIQERTSINLNVPGGD